MMDVRKIRAEMRMGRSIFDLPLRVTFYARVSTDKDEQINSLENQEAYLIVGFNEYNVVLMDPKTGKVYKKGMNDSREMFEKEGNQFITYMRL